MRFKGSAPHLDEDIFATIFFAACRDHRTGSIRPSRAAQCSTLQCVPSAMLAPGLKSLPPPLTDAGDGATLLPPPSPPLPTQPHLLQSPLNKPPALDDLANHHNSHAEAQKTRGEEGRQEERRGEEGREAPSSFFLYCLSLPFFSSPPPLVSFSPPQNFEIICVSWVFYTF